MVEQTGGAVDGFICAVGSGGTLAGTGIGLRNMKPGVKIGIADPEGAALFEYYKNYIGTMDSVDELQSTSKVYNFVLEAFGFDPKDTKKKVIEQALTSDLNDPESFANKQKDPRYKELAAAFNFGADGQKDEKFSPRIGATVNVAPGARVLLDSLTSDRLKLV